MVIETRLNSLCPFWRGRRTAVARTPSPSSGWFATFWRTGARALRSRLACSGVRWPMSCWTPPTYTADALLRVQAPREFGLGQLANLTRALDVRDPNVLGEIEVLKSRATVGTAIMAVNGHVKVTVLHSVPLVGTQLQGWLAQDADGLTRPPFGLSWFAWGGEHLGLSAVDVPTPGWVMT